jgi:acyl carrier protein
MSPQERREQIHAILAEIAETDVDEVVDAKRLREDLGFDSLRSLEMLSTVSEALGIDLPMEEAIALTTVADACDFVERAWNEQRGPSARA